MELEFKVQQNSDPINMIHKTFATGQLDTVKKLVKTKKISADNAMILAAKYGQKKICVWLVSNYWNQLDYYKTSNSSKQKCPQEHPNIDANPLHYAVCYGHLKVVEFLTKIFDSVKFGLSAPIAHAVHHGHMGIAMWLMDHYETNQKGVVQWIRNKIGSPQVHPAKWALCEAVNKGHVSIVQWLLETYGPEKCDLTSVYTKHAKHNVVTLAAAGGHLGVN